MEDWYDNEMGGEVNEDNLPDAIMEDGKDGVEGCWMIYYALTSPENPIDDPYHVPQNATDTDVYTDTTTEEPYPVPPTETGADDFYATDANVFTDPKTNPSM